MNNTNVTNPCDYVEDFQNVFFFYYLCITAGLTFLLSFLSQRVHLRQNCCFRRPGLSWPVTMLGPARRRWAYLAVFGAMSYHVMALFDGQYYVRPAQMLDEDWMAKYGFIKILVGMMNVILISIAFFPLLTCITYRHYITANVVGLLAIVPWLVVKIYVIVMCPPASTQGQANWRSIMELVYSLPHYICYLSLILCYTMDLVLNVRQKLRRGRRYDTKSPATMMQEVSLDEQYVIDLFNRSSVVSSSVPGFRYPPRMLITMVCACFSIYRFQLMVTTYLAKFRGAAHQPDLVAAAQAGNQTTTLRRLQEALLLSETVLGVSLNFSFFLHLLYMVHMIACYRKNLMKYYIGKRNWHFKVQDSPASRTVNALRYAGYQIAYLLYGYLIFAVIFAVIWFVILFFVILPLRDGYTTFVLERIKQLWPTAVISLAVYYVQLIVCKLAFLQDKGAFMALNNIRAFHLFSYFLFFFNVLLGLFGALKRILFSMVFGTLLLSRLDRCLLMRGFEKFDTGHKAYLGMLHMDLYHNNPLLKVFVEILVRSQHPSHDQEISSNSTSFSNKPVTARSGRHRLVRNRWWKAYTLVNNPLLMLENLQKEARKMQQVKAIDIKEEIIHGVGNAGAFLAMTLTSPIIEQAVHI